MTYSISQVVRLNLNEYSVETMGTFIEGHRLLQDAITSWFKDDLVSANQSRELSLNRFYDHIRLVDNRKHDGIGRPLLYEDGMRIVERQEIYHWAFSVLDRYSLPMPRYFGDLFVVSRGLAQESTRHINVDFVDLFRGHGIARISISEANKQREVIEALAILAAPLQ